MSATTFPQQHRPTATPARTGPADRGPEPETTSDHGYLIKAIASVLVVTVTVAIIASFGWAALAAGVAVLLATTAAVLQATLRLLNEADEENLHRR